MGNTFAAYRFARVLALLAAWGTCLSPLLLQAQCCCSIQRGIEDGSTLRILDQVVVQRGCCQAREHNARAGTTGLRCETQDTFGTPDVAASKQSCECRLSCCEPEVIVLAGASSLTDRQWGFAPTLSKLETGFVDRDDFAVGGSRDPVGGSLRATDSISNCALLCRWRN